MPPAISSDFYFLDTSRSDEFNGPTLDTTKWWTVDPCNFTDSIHHGYNWSPGAYFRPQNVSVSNDNLIITISYNPDSLNDSFPCIHHHLYRFYSGGIQSRQIRNPEIGVAGNYSYGYYEMKAKLPGYYNVNHQSVGLGFMPTFWFYYEYFKDSCLKKHDEVDILEPNPAQYYDAKTNVVGWHDETDTCTAHKIGEDSVKSTSPLFNDYHKYAVKLLPDKIIFYFDDIPFFSADTITSPQYIHSLNFSPYQAVVMNVQMGNNPYPPSDASFPEHMYIDYFRYYPLKSSTSSGNILFQNYPNPFINTTQISYSVTSKAENIFIKIYDITGREIKAIKITEVGKSNITLNCSDLNSGAYFYCLSINNILVDAKKMLLLKQ